MGGIFSLQSPIQNDSTRITLHKIGYYIVHLISAFKVFLKEKFYESQMEDKRMNGKTMQCCIIHIFQDFFI